MSYNVPVDVGPGEAARLLRSNAGTATLLRISVIGSANAARLMVAAQQTLYSGALGVDDVFLHTADFGGSSITVSNLGVVGAVRVLVVGLVALKP